MCHYYEKFPLISMEKWLQTHVQNKGQIEGTALNFKKSLGSFSSIYHEINLTGLGEF